MSTFTPSYLKLSLVRQFQSFRNPASGFEQTFNVTREIWNFLLDFLLPVLDSVLLIQTFNSIFFAYSVTIVFCYRPLPCLRRQVCDLSQSNCWSRSLDPREPTSLYRTEFWTLISLRCKSQQGKQNKGEFL